MLSVNNTECCNYAACFNAEYLYAESHSAVCRCADSCGAVDFKQKVFNDQKNKCPPATANWLLQVPVL
jgi:hypothetical protein